MPFIRFIDDRLLKGAGLNLKLDRLLYRDHRHTLLAALGVIHHIKFGQIQRDGTLLKCVYKRSAAL